jgi:16S rRNA (cytosine1402-N4)-methyltransferase
MMGSGDGFPAVAGGPAPHIPVLGRQAVDALNVRPDGRYIDATFGNGGYTTLIVAKLGPLVGPLSGRVLGLDRDRSAIAAGYRLVEASDGRLTLVESRFSEIEDAARGFAQGFVPVDGIVFDLGVSSMQLDRAERGFSFRNDGPLDMRMGPDGPSAADVVARASERSLADIVYRLGEERQSRAIARAIVRRRAEAPIATTKALADIVASVVRGKPGDIHPATRTFQALRMFVNDELGELVAALAASERLLAPDGRLVVVSFHSLEDRIVKTFLADRGETHGGSRHAPEVRRVPPTFTVLTRRVVTPDADEIAANPRARSAKLRAAARTAAAPRATMPDLLPDLPSLADVMRGA